MRHWCNFHFTQGVKYATIKVWSEGIISKRRLHIDATALARAVVELADERQASDIVMLDIRQVSTIADYFVICSAESDRQIRAVVEAVDDGIKKQTGLDPRIEGTPDTGWVVLDYRDVVVHVFSEEQREFYRLERLWSNAAPVVVLQ